MERWMLCLLCLALSACSSGLRQLEMSQERADADISVHYVLRSPDRIWGGTGVISIGSVRRSRLTSTPIPDLPDPSQAEFHSILVVHAGQVTIWLELMEGHPCLPELDLDLQRYQMQGPNLWSELESGYEVRLRLTSMPEYSHRASVQKGQALEFYSFLDKCDSWTLGYVFATQVARVFHELAHLEHHRHDRQHGALRPRPTLAAEFAGMPPTRLFRELLAEFAELCSLRRIPGAWALPKFDYRMQLEDKTADLPQRYLEYLQEKTILGSYQRNPRLFNRRALSGVGTLAELLAVDLKSEVLDAEKHDPNGALPTCLNLFQPEGMRATADWLEQVLDSVK